MQAVLLDQKVLPPFTDAPDLTDDDQFFDFCQLFPKLRIERTAEGEVIIVPPVGFESGNQEAEVLGQLHHWAKGNGKGKAFGSNTEYILPNRAAYAPDASWVSKAQIQKLSRADKARFPHIVPEFIVEVRSPSDRLTRLRAKMQDWIDNGVQLAWMVDVQRRSVTVYRPTQSPETLVDPSEVVGDGPVKGFRLKMTDVWAASSLATAPVPSRNSRTRNAGCPATRS